MATLWTRGNVGVGKYSLFHGASGYRFPFNKNNPKVIGSIKHLPNFPSSGDFSRSLEETQHQTSQIMVISCFDLLSCFALEVFVTVKLRIKRLEHHIFWVNILKHVYFCSTLFISFTWKNTSCHKATTTQSHRKSHLFTRTMSNTKRIKKCNSEVSCRDRLRSAGLRSLQGSGYGSGYKPIDINGVMGKWLYKYTVTAVVTEMVKSKCFALRVFSGSIYRTF